MVRETNGEEESERGMKMGRRWRKEKEKSKGKGDRKRKRSTEKWRNGKKKRMEIKRK